MSLHAPALDRIRFSEVSVRYPHAASLALREVNLDIAEGEFVLFLGGSGSGKSTLLRTVNGLVPHATGGHMSGQVTSFGRLVAEHRPRDLADLVGFVHQDPEAQFVTDRVEADVAFVLENLAVGDAALRRRVEEALDGLGVAHLRHRAPSELSGGERQRCAIAGALAAAPRILVLDEPTSQLDPQGADDVLAAVGRLHADLGTTVLLAEHRVERAGPMADRAILLDQGTIAADGDSRDVLVDYDGAAPVTRLGTLMGWQPVPLTVREARTHARQLHLPPPPRPTESAPGPAALSAHHVAVQLGRQRALHDVSLTLHTGEIVALLGRNGAGKTTLLRALAGLQPLERGSVTRNGRSGFVPQDPNALLFADTVRQELVDTLRLLGQRDTVTVDEVLDEFALLPLADRHPRSLSGGQRQRLAVAAVAVSAPPVLLLDEPTRGIDAESRARLAHGIRRRAAAGTAVLLATHDVELAAQVAQRVIVLGEGEVLADGPAHRVLADSLFAPQVLRVLPGYLSVEEVTATHGLDA